MNPPSLASCVDLKRTAAWLAPCLCAALTACATPTPSITPAPQVDIARFMGDWYVIAHIPTFPEKNAFNAVESYAQRPDGRIQTDFRYRDGSFEAPVKTLHPVGTVRPDTGNAVWGMQFIWPIQAEYVIADVSADYQSTIVARSKRDYVWLMARTPELTPESYAQALRKIEALGYDLAKLRRVPQRWPER